MNKPCTGQRAGMTPYAALHAGCSQDLHLLSLSLIPEVQIAHVFAFDCAATAAASSFAFSWSPR